MSIDETVKLINAITELLGVIIWPLLLIFILFRFHPALKEFFNGVAELSFKGGGFEATAKREQVEAAVALSAAALSKPDQPKANTKEITDLVSNVVDEKLIKRTKNAKALWVDDRPNNNIYERQSLEAVGISFVLATSTEEALDKISQQSFDVIISDMGRPPDMRAGYTLLNKLRTVNNQVPFVIYAGSNAVEHKREALRKGAIGSTNRATELFGYVVSAISYKNG